MPEAPAGSTLAFDFGAQRTGVAQGDAQISIAHPLAMIVASDKNMRLKQIEMLSKVWRPQQWVVGIPTHRDGQAHEMTLRCQKFARQLSAHFRQPVYLVDERFSSVFAQSLLDEAAIYGKRRQAALDQVAAQAILQGFFAGEFTVLPPRSPFQAA